MAGTGEQRRRDRATDTVALQRAMRAVLGEYLPRRRSGLSRALTGVLALVAFVFAFGVSAPLDPAPAIVWGLVGVAVLLAAR